MTALAALLGIVAIFELAVITSMRFRQIELEEERKAAWAAVRREQRRHDD